MRTPLLLLLLLQTATLIWSVQPEPILDTSCNPIAWRRDGTQAPASSCGGCDYGSLPGWWHLGRSIGLGERWRLLRPECRQQNLITKAKKNAAASADPLTPPLGLDCPDVAAVKPKIVLLLGDSVDRQLLEAVSEHLTLPMSKCARVRFVATACGDAAFATVHLYGSALQGPWHYNITDPFPVILADALHTWRDVLRLPDPDMVIINSHMWDLARMRVIAMQNTSSWWHREPVLPEEFLDSWAANTTLLVRHVQAMFPGAVLGWHTAAPAAYSRDGTAHWNLGRLSYIVQMNAAGRELASRLGLLLVDYEVMVRGFSDFSYLLDRHHPSHAIQLEVANLYLNLLAQLPRVPDLSMLCRQTLRFGAVTSRDANQQPAT